MRSVQCLAGPPVGSLSECSFADWCSSACAGGREALAGRARSAAGGAANTVTFGRDASAAYSTVASCVLVTEFSDEDRREDCCEEPEVHANAPPLRGFDPTRSSGTPPRPRTPGDCTKGHTAGRGAAPSSQRSVDPPQRGCSTMPAYAYQTQPER